MAFKRDYQPLGIEHVQEQKKRLPYTVTDIGGKAELAYWKAERAKLEAAWQAAKEAKRQEVIRSIEDGTAANKHYGESETTKAYRRYEADQAAQKAFARTEVNPVKNLTLKPESSILTRIYNWCLEKFLDIKL